MTADDTSSVSQLIYFVVCGKSLLKFTALCYLINANMYIYIEMCNFFAYLTLLYISATLL